MPRKITGHCIALAVILLTLSLPLFADDGVDARINEAVKPFADTVSGLIFVSFPVAGVQIPFVLVWLIFAATLFTEPTAVSGDGSVDRCDRALPRCSSLHPQRG